jgi:hypothetical protein
LFHLHDASAVVEFVRYIGGLWLDGAHLSDEGYGADGFAVDAEVGVGMGLGGCEDLEDGDRADCVFAETLLERLLVCEGREW